jgi:hypothetical protein
MAFGCQVRPALAKLARRQHQHPIARRGQIRDRSLHGSRAGARQQQHVILRAHKNLQLRQHLLEKGAKLRRAVVNVGRRHGKLGCGKQRSRTGCEQARLVNHDFSSFLAGACGGYVNPRWTGSSQYGSGSVSPRPSVNHRIHTFVVYVNNIVREFLRRSKWNPSPKTGAPRSQLIPTPGILRKIMGSGLKTGKKRTLGFRCEELRCPKSHSLAHQLRPDPNCLQAVQLSTALSAES